MSNFNGMGDKGLHFFLEHGIIDDEECLCEAFRKMNRMQTIFKGAVESHKVWKGGGKDKRWKFKNSGGKIVAKTNEHDIMVAYLQSIGELETNAPAKLTFEVVYGEWLDYR